MKPFISSRLLVCNYDSERGKFTINYEGGLFETPSEEIFVNQLHKMLGAPHQSNDVSLLNKHVTLQRSFPLQHLTLRMAYVVQPLDALLSYRSEPATWPTYYEVCVYDYSQRKIVERCCYRTKESAERVYKLTERRLTVNESDIQFFLD